MNDFEAADDPEEVGGLKTAVDLEALGVKAKHKFRGFGEPKQSQVGLGTKRWMTTSRPWTTPRRCGRPRGTRREGETQWDLEPRGGGRPRGLGRPRGGVVDLEALGVRAKHKFVAAKNENNTKWDLEPKGGGRPRGRERPRGSSWKTTKRNQMTSLHIYAHMRPLSDDTFPLASECNNLPSDRRKLHELVNTVHAHCMYFLLYSLLFFSLFPLSWLPQSTATFNQPAYTLLISYWLTQPTATLNLSADMHYSSLLDSLHPPLKENFAITKTKGKPRTPREWGRCISQWVEAAANGGAAWEDDGDGWQSRNL
nr:hypothetical protein Itr_chr15CG11190 [Ipomoea trifida]